MPFSKACLCRHGILEGLLPAEASAGQCLQSRLHPGRSAPHAPPKGHPKFPSVDTASASGGRSRFLLRPGRPGCSLSCSRPGAYKPRRRQPPPETARGPTRPNRHSGLQGGRLFSFTATDTPKCFLFCRVDGTSGVWLTTLFPQHLQERSTGLRHPGPAGGTLP